MELILENKEELMAQMEAILFVAGEPVGVEQICKGMDMTRPEVDSVMTDLIAQYEFQQRGIRILKLDSSYQMCSAPEFAPVVRKILETRTAPKLSQPALEVLAIVAYHQPTTRTYVDQVRGVDSAYTVGLLVERGLLEECGKLKDVPGRPLLYRTTKSFLRSFHMENLGDLPQLGSPQVENQQLSIEERLRELEQQDENLEENKEKNEEETDGQLKIEEGIRLEIKEEEIQEKASIIEDVENEMQEKTSVNEEVVEKIQEKASIIEDVENEMKEKISANEEVVDEIQENDP